MKQITKWKLKNKKSNVKINGLKTIYVNGQELYFDGFNALSFDTQQNSNGKTLEYVLNKDGKLEHLKNNNKQFFVLPCEQNKYFWVSKSKNNNQRPINGIRGRALNPLINNKKKLDILQRCLLKHYFGININTESSSNIPIQIVYYVRSIEKLFVLYINEITNSLNNQFYNQNKNIEKQIDLFATTYFKDEKYSITYNETKWTKKNEKVEKRNFDQNKLKIEKLIKTIIYFKQFYQNIYSYLENDQDKQKKENENEKIYKILQILSFIRNNYVLGLFKEDLNDTNDLKNIVQKNAVELLKTKINEFQQEYQSAKLYQLSKFILKRINWFIKLKDIDKEFYDFILNNKVKNFGISIKKIRECIINKKDKEKYIKQKSIRYVNMCYDFLIWYFLSKNQCMNNNFLRFLQENKNEELNKIYKQKIYPEIENKYKKLFNKLKSQFYDDEFENIIEHYEFKQKLKKLNNTKIESITNNDKTDEPPYFTGFVYVICCFLDNKEINEFTNFLIKYLISIKSLINICETNIFSNNKLIFKHFYECYSTFKPDNISKIINYLYKIQIISNLGKKFDTINENDENDKEKWLEYVYKLFPLSDDKKNNKEIKNLLISNIAKSRKFAYVLKHVNLSSSIELFKNKQLVKFIISNQISKQQINKWFYCNIKKNKKVKQSEDYKIDKIEKLTNQIYELKIDNFKQTQYLFQIYLSILFLFIKSLKRINVLYAMAWITYDQDWYLLKNYYWCPLEKYFKNSDVIHYIHETYDDSDYKFYITKEMILENDNICGKNKKSQIFKKIIENLIQKFDKFMEQKGLIKSIRNSVIHFDIFKAINVYITQYNSPDPKKITYFNIYQYLFQSNWNKWTENKLHEEINKSFIPNNNNNSLYCKKQLKVMNLPFAYCIARYKQLTNEQIFNKLQKFGKDNIKN